jgi:hypothetical protein
MTSESSPYAWLETLLELFFERYDADAARALLRDEPAWRTALLQLRPELLQMGAAQDLLDSGEGDNLSMAVLALRLKFNRSEALEKVRLNIAMRERR